MELLGEMRVRTTARENAVLSAQVPTEYAAFSTLAPLIYCPLLVRIVAPTLNLE